MQGIERRVAALETRARAIDGAWKLVFVADGESNADAFKRTGYPPGAENVMCVMFVTPNDERL